MADQCRLWKRFGIRYTSSVGERRTPVNPMHRPHAGRLTTAIHLPGNQWELSQSSAVCSSPRAGNPYDPLPENRRHSLPFDLAVRQSA